MNNRVGLFTKWLFIFLALAVLFVFAVRSISNLDIWLHLKTGQLMLENHSVFRSDPYSFAAGGIKWTNMEWLTQVIFYSVYKLAGVDALIWLKFFVLLLVFVPFMFFFFKRRIFYFAWYLLLITIMVSEVRFMVRPQIFSLAFASLFLFVFFMFRYRRVRRVIYFLPVIQILWVNMHGYFVLGIVFIWLFILGEYISAFLKNHLNIGEDVILEPDDMRALRNTGLLVIGASFLSPYFIDAFMYPVRVYQQAASGGFMRDYIKELAPIMESYAKVRVIPFIFFNMLFLLTTISFCVNVRKFRPVLFVLFAVSLYFAFSMVRHVDIFAVIAMWVCAKNFEDIVDDLSVRSKIGQYFSRVFLSGTTYLCLSLPIFQFCVNAVTQGHYFQQHPSRFGFGIIEAAYPVKALDFLEKNGLKGRMFSNFSAGPYLIWKLYPQKVFIDGRTEIYYDFTLEDYVNFDSFVLRLWDRIYDFDLAVIQYGLINTEKLIFVFYQDPGWSLIYIDEATCVFAKRREGDTKSNTLAPIVLEDMDASDISLDKKLKRSEDDRLYLLPYVSPAQLLRKFRFYPAAIKFYKRIIEVNPQTLVSYNNMASSFAAEFDFKDAIKSVDDGLKIAPDNKILKLNREIIIKQSAEYDDFLERLEQAYVGKEPPEYFLNMALEYESRGWLEAAVRVYDSAVELYPQREDIYAYLGELYYKSNQYEKAVQVFKDALRNCAGSDGLYVSLGAVQAKQKRYKEAAESFEKAIKINKDNANIYYNYGLMYAEMGRYEDCIRMWENVLEHSQDKKIVQSSINRIKDLKEHEDFLRRAYIRE